MRVSDLGGARPVQPRLNHEMDDEEFLENLKEMIAKQFDGKKGCRDEGEEGEGEVGTP